MRCSRCKKPKLADGFGCCEPCRLRDRERDKVRDRAEHDRRKYERRKARGYYEGRSQRRAMKPRACRRCGNATVTPRHHYCAVCREWAIARRAKSQQARRRLRDARRQANSTARGYGYAHQKLRKQWEKRVMAGEVKCARCGLWIFPGEPWDLGHDDRDRSQYNGPEHARCNRATASHARPRRRKAPRANWW